MCKEDQKFINTRDERGKLTKYYLSDDTSARGVSWRVLKDHALESDYLKSNEFNNLTDQQKATVKNLIAAQKAQGDKGELLPRDTHAGPDCPFRKVGRVTEWLLRSDSQRGRLNLPVDKDILFMTMALADFSMSTTLIAQWLEHPDVKDHLECQKEERKAFEETVRTIQKQHKERKEKERKAKEEKEGIV